MEVDLQSKCNKWLRDKGWLYFHDERGSNKGKRHRGGLPDIIIFKQPVLFIELKKPGGKLKPSQLDYHYKLIKENHLIYTVDTFNDFLLCIKETYG
jgi:hypothetical protein